MRFMSGLSLAIVCIVGVPALAQDTGDALPPRFRPLAKNDRFRLLRVLGTPDLPAVFRQASAFSADGKRAIYAEDLSTGGDDAPRLRTRLLVWDVQAKNWPREIEIDGKSVTALTLSADGARALLACQTYIGKPRAKTDKEKDKDRDPEKDYRAYLSLWDLEAGKEIHGFPTPENLIKCVDLAADRATALAGSPTGIKRWDLKQGKAIGSFNEPEATSLAFLPRGDRFVACYPFGKAILWDVTKAKPVRVHEGKKVATLLWCLAVAKDGNRYAVGDAEKSVALFETDTGKEVNRLQSAKEGVEIVTAVALAGDGKTVLSVWAKTDPDLDEYASARLVAWDGDANKILWSRPVPYRGRLPILVQGDRLLVGGGPNLFEIWSIKDGKKLESWGGHKGPIQSIAGLANGDILSAGQEGLVMTWKQGKLVGKRPSHAGAIGVLALSPDRKQWLTGGADRLIKLWNADADKPLQVFKGHAGPVTALAFSKDMHWSASSAGERTVKTWDLKTGKELATLVGHSEAINAVAISPDDRWLATGGDDAAIRVWPIKDGKLDPDRESLLLEHHKKPITCLAFAPDGKTLISGSQDQTLKVWDWAKEKVMRTIPGHKNWVTSVLFMNDKTVLTTSDDLTICVWDLASGNEVGRIDFGAVGDCPRCVARLGADRLLVGTSNWLIYEFQMLPAAK